MNRALCLDGPLNGLYASEDEAEPLGYTLSPWQEAFPEPVFVHTRTMLDAMTTDGVPVEFDQEEGYER